MVLWLKGFVLLVFVCVFVFVTVCDLSFTIAVQFWSSVRGPIITGFPGRHSGPTEVIPAKFLVCPATPTHHAVSQPLSLMLSQHMQKYTGIWLTTALHVVYLSTLALLRNFNLLSLVCIYTMTKQKWCQLELNPRMLYCHGGLQISEHCFFKSMCILAIAYKVTCQVVPNISGLGQPFPLI